MVGEGTFCPSTQREVSDPTEVPFGRVRYGLAHVPPQPNCPPAGFALVLCTSKGSALCARQCLAHVYPHEAGITESMNEASPTRSSCLHRPSLDESCQATMRVVVFHWRRTSHLSSTPHVTRPRLVAVKLNRVFLPRSTRSSLFP